MTTPGIASCVRARRHVPGYFERTPGLLRGPLAAFDLVA
jgi:hypothetical protein